MEEVKTGLKRLKEPPGTARTRQPRLRAQDYRHRGQPRAALA